MNFVALCGMLYIATASDWSNQCAQAASHAARYVRKESDQQKQDKIKSKKLTSCKVADSRV